MGGEDGDPLPYVPEWSFGLNADYEWTVKGSTRAYVGGSLGYTGDRTVQFGNRAADGSIRQADGFATLNLRAGAYVSRWSVEVYGKNLTNERGITSIDEAGPLPNGALALGLIRPRIDRNVGRRRGSGARRAPAETMSHRRGRPRSPPRSCCLAGAARAEPPAGFDARVEQIRNGGRRSGHGRRRSWRRAA